jgi:hypothetical protein
MLASVLWLGPPQPWWLAPVGLRQFCRANVAAVGVARNGFNARL